jgi:acyl carrier protein
MTTTQDVVVGEISKRLGLRPGEPLDLHEQLLERGFDSLDAMEVVLELEQKYDIEFLDAEVANIKTAHDAVVLVENKLGEKNLKGVL